MRLNPEFVAAGRTRFIFLVMCVCLYFSGNCVRGGRRKLHRVPKPGGLRQGTAILLLLLLLLVRRRRRIKLFV